MVMTNSAAAALYRQNAGVNLQTANRLPTPSVGSSFQDMISAATTRVDEQTSAALSQPVNFLQGAASQENSPAMDSFLRSVSSFVGTTRDNQLRAESVALDAVVGEASVTDLVTAISSAETSLQTIVTIRDRVISAYQEIMRMPI